MIRLVPAIELGIQTALCIQVLEINFFGMSAEGRRPYI